MWIHLHERVPHKGISSVNRASASDEAAELAREIEVSFCSMQGLTLVLRLYIHEHDMLLSSMRSRPSRYSAQLSLAFVKSPSCFWMHCR